jgi:hypothetical protein
MEVSWFRRKEPFMSDESFELSVEEATALVEAYGETLLSDEQLDEISGGDVVEVNEDPRREYTLTCSQCGTQFLVLLSKDSIPPTMCMNCAVRYYQTHPMPPIKH